MSCSVWDAHIKHRVQLQCVVGLLYTLGVTLFFFLSENCDRLDKTALPFGLEYYACLCVQRNPCNLSNLYQILKPGSYFLRMRTQLKSARLTCEKSLRKEGCNVKFTSHLHSHEPGILGKISTEARFILPANAQLDTTWLFSKWMLRSCTAQLHFCELFVVNLRLQTSYCIRREYELGFSHYWLWGIMWGKYNQENLQTSKSFMVTFFI